MVRWALGWDEGPKTSSITAKFSNECEKPGLPSDSPNRCYITAPIVQIVDWVVREEQQYGEVSKEWFNMQDINFSAEKDSIGVRVGVKSGGCAGMSYVLEYAKETKPNDEVIEDKGVKVFIDPAAVMYLLGTEMDYKKEEFSSSFVFNNPNETERCGCGESFKIT